MNQNDGVFSQENMDIIGEVSNISMGSAATALSNILGTKVNITSPVVEMGGEETINKIKRIPSIGVIISFVGGIMGENILVIKLADAKKIVNVLMDGQMLEDEEFGELHISAMGEIMNQMMGSAATALATFVGTQVNLSPPDSFILTNENKAEKLSTLYDNIHHLISVKFLFTVENMFESDLYVIMPTDFAQELIDAMLINMGMALGPATQAETHQPAAPVPPPVPREPSAQAQAAAMRAPVMQTAVRPAVLPDFSPVQALASESPGNFELIRDVPLDLSVEVGRAKKLVREVMDFSVGSIIELDKQAGDPVDIIVSGQLIAHGEVVVIDESFGVRVTEIINQKTKR